jgi:Mn-dependent DtxR family transcriptional regulator
LEAFRELCEQGLVIHQLQKEFSLTERGFTIADGLRRETFAEDFSFARNVDQ